VLSKRCGPASATARALTRDDAIAGRSHVGKMRFRCRGKRGRRYPELRDRNELCYRRGDLYPLGGCIRLLINDGGCVSGNENSKALSGMIYDSPASV